MKHIILVVTAICLLQISPAQKRYFTKTGIISFNASTALEDVNAINKSTTCIFDANTGQIDFQLLIKGFEFKKALMQEHFNENYLESSKYPKSTFKGKVTNIDKVDFQKDGSYPVTVTGILEIHGVKKEITANGQFQVSGETILSSAEFSVRLEDFQIAIPSLVKDKISKTATIKVNCNNTIFK
jgi:hypothetical protein